MQRLHALLEKYAIIILGAAELKNAKKENVKEAPQGRSEGSPMLLKWRNLATSELNDIWPDATSPLFGGEKVAQYPLGHWSRAVAVAVWR